MPRTKARTPLSLPPPLPTEVGELRSLDEAQMQTWLPLLRVLQLLPQALDRQLREQAGVNHAYYMMLAILSGQPEHRLPLTDLARLAAMSQSRTSHAVSSLEQKGWVERQPCPDDRRLQYTVLTQSGTQVLTDSAPGHVAEVCRLVFDSSTARTSTTCAASP